jgi:large subunit ribosomal protein L4
MKLRTYTTTGKDLTIEGNDSIFAAPVNQALLSQVVHVYLVNQRQGTAKAKTRGEVRLTTKKWFKQKGTGNARHGAKSAPQFVKGGVAHGPTGLENWHRSAPTTMKRKALICALTAQVKNVVVCNDLEKLDGKTSSGSRLIKAITPGAKKVLVVIFGQEPHILRSLNNIPTVLMTQPHRLTALEIMSADAIIMTKTALEKLDERLLAKAKPAVKAEIKTEVKVEKVAAKPAKVVAKKPAAKKPAAKKAATKTVKK